MSRKKFSALAISLAIVILAVTLLIPEPTGREQLLDGGLLAPDLAERVNDINRLTVTGAGGKMVATLERGEQQWTVSELGAYPANWERVRDLLAGLARAEILELKTANPDYHARLGVEDIDEPQAGGQMIEVKGGDFSLAVIIGNEAKGRNGRYLRLADTAQSVLADFDARVPATAVDWAERQVTDIASAEVAEVEIVHADGETVLARKSSADESDFTLVNQPEGRELQSSWSVNSLGGVLTALQMDGVKPAAEIDWQEAARVRVLTFSGLEVQVDAALIGEDHWIRLNAAAPYATAAEDASSADTATTVDAAQPTGEKEVDGGETGAKSDAEAAAAEFNAQVAGWAYKIPAYKFEAMTKRLEAMLKPLDEET